MAALKEVCKYYKGDIEDGCCWVAIWKEGRSWRGEAFYQEDGGYNEGYRFTVEDMERMQDIIKADHKAVMLNGYYTNCGAHEDGGAVPLADIIAGVEWNYYNRLNQLFGFYDCMVIK